MREFKKEVTSSREKAVSALRAVGYIDADGQVSLKYRDQSHK